MDNDCSKELTAALKKARFAYECTMQRSGAYDWAMTSGNGRWSGHSVSEYEALCCAYETAIGPLPKHCWPQATEANDA